MLTTSRRPRWASTPWPRPLESLRILLVACQFLTRLPVPQIPVVDGDLRRATAAFPLVGLLIGALCAAVFVAADLLLTPLVAAVAAVAAAAALTGAFHEDGLADTFDGLWGGWDPEQRLRIMRDSRVGTYGAMALVIAISVQVAALGALDATTAVRALVAGHVTSRAAILVQIRALPPVDDQGSGARVAEPVGLVGTVVALVVTGATLALTSGWLAVLIVAVALLGVGAIRRAARRRLGGLTGDLLGATQQVVLILVLLTVLAIDQRGGW